MIERIAVSSADFIRNIGRWQQEALQHPIVITHHGRERLVLAAPERFKLDAANESIPADESWSELRAAYAALLAHMEEGCLSFLPDGRIESANEAAAEFLGRSQAELQGRTLTGVLPDLTSLIIMDRIQRVWRTRAAEQFDVDTSDGRRLCFRVYACARTVTVLFHNATEETRLQRELEEVRSIDQAGRLNSEVAVLKLDARGRFETVDDVFCRWTGFNAAELVGHRLAELVPTEERRNVSVFVERILRDPATDQVALDLLGRGGTATRCNVSLAPIVSDFVPRGIVAMAVRTG